MQDPATPLTPTSGATGVSETRGWVERLWSSVADRGRSYADVLQPRAGKLPPDRARELAPRCCPSAAKRPARPSPGNSSPCSATWRGRPARLLRLPRQQLPARGGGCSRRPSLPGRPYAGAGHRAGQRGRAGAPGAAAADEHGARRHRRAGRHAQGLLPSARRPGAAAPRFRLRHLLGSWFNRGFLELRRIDWQTPAAVLEKLITYEAVHEIQGWEDLRRRLAPDRRCFGFFHPALPGDPLIFVEVALTAGLADAVAAAAGARRRRGRAATARAEADTAIFYSISNCQEGLRGVSFGNFLIKQVVEELKRELPRMSTLRHPLAGPGFRRWLERANGRAEELGRFHAAAMARPWSGPSWMSEAWSEDPPRRGRCSRRSCARRRLLPDRDRPRQGPSLDPVARFHLGNGARLERLDRLGDLSPGGCASACGMMVNYLYDLDDRAEPRGLRDRGRGGALGGGRCVAPTAAAAARRGAAFRLHPPARRRGEVRPEACLIRLPLLA